MLSRMMNVDPVHEVRAMEEMFNRMFAQPFGATDSRMQVSTLPVDIFEKDNSLVIRAAVPGVRPEDLDVSIENNVLTIRGETHSEFQNAEGTKVYRREVSYGSFARSIRLPEKLQFDKADAEFNHGFVTITLPKIEEQKAQPRKLNVRSADQGKTVSVQNQDGQPVEDKASLQ